MTRGPIAAEPEPKQIRPRVDTREQLPYRFPNLGEPIVEALNVGDYSYAGGESLLRIERKSGPDYLGSIFTDRFAREMELIKAFPAHVLLIEGDWDWLESGNYRIKATAKQVTGKTLGFIESGVNVVLAGNRERAEQIAERLIFMSARRRWRELRQMVCAAVEDSASAT